MNFEDVITAWKKASTELGIKVEAPFIFNTGKGQIEFPMLVLGFGREKGTVILDIENDRHLGGIAEQHGFYYSFLSEVYAQYDSEQFKDTLEDWGFHGDKGQKPDWYEGKYHEG